ncbi:MAG: hypothetical protein NTY01_18605 [Verrucomicrobia bacterium]|nr:hypothetical protein [Verrucomicrobiota bacterium]
MKTTHHLFASTAFALIAMSLPVNGAESKPIAVELGKPETLLADRQHGLRYFPDELTVIVRTNPNYRVLLAASIRTVLLEGDSMTRLAPPRDVLLPGKAGEFDNGYAGISGAWRAPSGELLAIYHAEDQEGMPRNKEGIPGFYCRVALAVSRDDGATFEKRGPFLTGQWAKVADGRFDQGVGDPCLFAEPGGEFLYCYYTSHEPVGGRSATICTARCPVADAMKPDAWRKFFEGGFTEPGLGGRDTPVMTSGLPDACAIFPQVTYVPALRQFVMFFCVSAWLESEKQGRSGIYAAFSDDGIRWPRARTQQIWKVPTIPVIGREIAWHATLALDDPVSSSLVGWLYYSYSESWGHKPPQKPHYFMRRRIEFKPAPGVGHSD